MTTQSLEDRIGEVVKTVRFPIEAGKIGEFSRAIKDEDPLFSDTATALGLGFTNLPAPLTFSVVSAHYAGGDATELPVRLGLDLSRLVHGEQRWRYDRHPVAGEILFGTTKLTAVDRRAGKAGEMIRVTLTTDYVDGAQRPVLTETAVLIELPET